MWEKELKNDPDKDFLFNGLKHGFPLIDSSDQHIHFIRSQNHASTIEHCDKVEKRIIEEIEDGNYVKVDPSTVKIVSPLAAIEKPDGDVRIIHDLSYPKGYSLNDHASKEECTYESIQDALDLLKPGMFMAKCDLKWAYRSVPIHPEHHTLTGLQWTFRGNHKATTLIDTAFPFGARKSPAHFNRITKAVKRMMERRGYNCIVFLDDFLLCEDSFEKCASALSTLIALLRALGFRINYKKICDPCQCLVFLGIQIDLTLNTLKLDPGKAHQLLTTLQELHCKTRLSKRLLEKLAGRLNWACNVITWGRAYMGTVFQAIRNLKASDHKMRPTPSLLSDLQWWVTSLQHTEHSKPIWAPQQPALIASTDSCLVAGGVFLHYNGAWMHANWAIDRPDLTSGHINLKELAMIDIALKAWAPDYPGHDFMFQCDNVTAVHTVNTGAAKHPKAMAIIKSIADTAVKHCITLTAAYIPGRYNQVADSISRLHIPGQFFRLSALLNDLHHPGTHPTYCLLNHMSPLTMLFLSPQVAQLQSVYSSWMRRLLH